MTKYKYIIFTIIAILFLLIYQDIKKVELSNENKILFINSSYNSRTNFTDQINGIYKELGKNFTLYNEVMCIDESNNKENIYNLTKKRINSIKGLDAVIVSSDDPLEFVIKYRNELFKYIPIVFFGVENQELIKDALNYNLVSGVRTVVSLDDNIELVRKIHKNVKNIYIVSDYEEDFYNQSVLHDKTKYTNKDLNIDYIATSNIKVNDFKEKIIDKLGADDAIIKINTSKFKDISIDDSKVYNAVFNPKQKIPVYSTVEDSLDYSDIGGKVISNYNQGRVAGKIVKNILLGKNESNLYIEDDLNKYIFDYDVMKRFGIKKTQLPKGSVINNDLIDDFNKYNVLFICSIIFSIGLIAIIIALAIYIHNKKKYEKMLLEVINESNEANRLKSHFISNITHELRTPITVIMSVMQLTKSKSENSQYILDENNFNLIGVNCNRLLRLINNIIDVEKYESDNINLELENINIVELIEDIVSSITPFIKAKNLDIIFDTTDEDIIMAIDINKMERIILNLLSNAIKFSNDNGIINVNLYKINNILKITIKDEGIGICESDLDKIFGRFVQLDTTTTRKNEGSGIGLTIVESFVKEHNGNISIQSEQNKGTIFTVEIPIVVLDEDIKDKKYYHKEIEKNLKLELSDIYI